MTWYNGDGTIASNQGGEVQERPQISGGATRIKGFHDSSVDENVFNSFVKATGDDNPELTGGPPSVGEQVLALARGEPNPLDVWQAQQNGEFLDNEIQKSPIPPETRPEGFDKPPSQDNNPGDLEDEDTEEEAKPEAEKEEEAEAEDEGEEEEKPAKKSADFSGLDSYLEKAEQKKVDYWRTINHQKVPFSGQPGKGEQLAGHPALTGQKPKGKAPEKTGTPQQQKAVEHLKKLGVNAEASGSQSISLTHEEGKKLIKEHGYPTKSIGSHGKGWGTSAEDIVKWAEGKGAESKGAPEKPKAAPEPTHEKAMTSMGTAFQKLHASGGKLTDTGRTPNYQDARSAMITTIAAAKRMKPKDRKVLLAEVRKHHKALQDHAKRLQQHHYSNKAKNPTPFDAVLEARKVRDLLENAKGLISKMKGQPIKPTESQKSETENDMDFLDDYIEKAKKQPSEGTSLTPEKARQMLHERSGGHGRPITEQQRKFFGAIGGHLPAPGKKKAMAPPPDPADRKEELEQEKEANREAGLQKTSCTHKACAEYKSCTMKAEYKSCGKYHKGEMEKATPVGGTTPGGYKRVAKDKYVKEGKEGKPSGGAETPKELYTSLANMVERKMQDISGPQRTKLEAQVQMMRALGQGKTPEQAKDTYGAMMMIRGLANKESKSKVMAEEGYQTMMKVVEAAKSKLAKPVKKSEMEKSMNDAIEILDTMDDVLEKAKYLKRTGTPGNYRYEYEAPKGHDVHMTTEIVDQINNDSDMHRQQHVPIIKNLVNKMASGNYQHAAAIKLFNYMTTAAAKKHGLNASTAERVAAAKQLTDQFEAEAKLGNYDEHLNKKNKKAVGSLKDKGGGEKKPTEKSEMDFLDDYIEKSTDHAGALGMYAPGFAKNRDARMAGGGPGTGGQGDGRGDMPASGGPREEMPEQGAESSDSGKKEYAEDGGVVAGAGTTTGAQSPSGNTTVGETAGTSGPSERALSADDAMSSKQMSPHKKPIETAKSEYDGVPIEGVVLDHEQMSPLQAMLRGSAFAKSAVLQKIEEGALTDLGLDELPEVETVHKSERRGPMAAASEEEPNFWMQKGGSVVYSDQEDRHIERAMEMGQDTSFYQTPTANFQGNLHKSESCCGCGEATPVIFDSCQHCGLEKSGLDGVVRGYDEGSLFLDDEVKKSLHPETEDDEVFWK